MKLEIALLSLIALHTPVASDGPKIRDVSRFFGTGKGH